MNNESNLNLNVSVTAQWDYRLQCDLDAMCEMFEDSDISDIHSVGRTAPVGYSDAPWSVRLTDVLD